jgi:cell division inhibitor SepF
MTALHRVKAYFGMVPADELDAYDGYGYGDRPGDRSESRHDDRWDDRHDEHVSRYEPRSRPRFDDLDDRQERFAPRVEASRAESRRDERDERESRDTRESYETTRPRTPRPRDPEHTEHRGEESDVDAASRTPRGRGWAHNTGPNHTSVRPSPSLGSGSRSVPSLSPVPPAAPTAAPRGASVAETPGRARAGESSTPAPAVEHVAPSEITSLQPKSYNEARVIGERYRDGIPVIMNLSDMDDVAAKRLVDFAAGLAFALRGSIEKVTNRVFLLSPPNVEVSAADRRKLAEHGYSASS